MNRRTGWMVALLLAVASPVRADPRAEAAAEAAAGDKALAAGDAAGALTRYQLAYEKYPSANLRFNMGLALAELGRPAEAADAFEDFLAGAKDPPRRIRDYARAQIDRLDRGLGKIDVKLPADAGAARVTIDGRAVRPGVRRVQPGSHEVRAEARGRKPFATTVEVAAGARAEVQVVLPALDLAVRKDPGDGGAPERRDGGGRSRMWLWGGVGAVALAAVITVLVISAGNGYPDSDLGAVEPRF